MPYRLVSMSAVLVTGRAGTQNSLFLLQQWLLPSPVLIAPTHGGMARPLLLRPPVVAHLGTKPWLHGK